MKFKISNLSLATQIFIAMLLGALFGLLMRLLPASVNLGQHYAQKIFAIGGTMFINAMKMLVVPIVLVSLVAGITSLKNTKNLGRLSLKSMAWFLFTTAVAASVALIAANLFKIGSHLSLPIPTTETVAAATSFEQFITNIVPDNLFSSLVSANVLQIVVIAILFGIAINLAKEHGTKIAAFFVELNAVMMELIKILMKFAPAGVFCLIAGLFYTIGAQLIIELLDYCLLMVATLLLYLFCFYGVLLKYVGKINPVTFFRKVLPLGLFAFSTSSSNASLPLAMEIAETQLGVPNQVVALTLPLGINMNKNGAAILQGIATVFIANLFHIHLGLMGNVLAVIIITITCIGTAGAHSMGLITLAVVLKQLGIPTSGIALVFGVDRILDMIRTAVSVIANVAIAHLVAKSENKKPLL